MKCKVNLQMYGQSFAYFQRTTLSNERDVCKGICVTGLLRRSQCWSVLLRPCCSWCYTCRGSIFTQQRPHECSSLCNCGYVDLSGIFFFLERMYFAYLFNENVIYLFEVLSHVCNCSDVYAGACNKPELLFYFMLIQRKRFLVFASNTT